MSLGTIGLVISSGAQSWPPTSGLSRGGSERMALAFGVKVGVAFDILLDLRVGSGGLA